MNPAVAVYQALVQIHVPTKLAQQPRFLLLPLCSLFARPRPPVCYNSSSEHHLL
jgi:hypothetical protein